jgi:hypothetical protein
MREVEFKVPRAAQLPNVDAIIEDACAAESLVIGMKGKMASFPGSTHWHFKRATERGILEITFFPLGRRIWAQVQDGRRGEWIDASLANIKQAVERKLKESKR